MHPFGPQGQPAVVSKSPPENPWVATCINIEHEKCSGRREKRSRMIGSQSIRHGRHSMFADTVSDIATFEALCLVNTTYGGQHQPRKLTVDG